MATSPRIPSPRTIELGLTITGAAAEEQLTHIDAAPVTVDDVCPDCAVPGRRRDHVIRDLVDLPVVGHPTRLHVEIPRFSCLNSSCSRTIFQARLACADDNTKLTRRTTRWILQRWAIDRVSVAATATALGVGWDLVNHVALDAIMDLVYGDPTHLEGVRILGAAEHVWKHTRRPGAPSSFVTVVVDLTPVTMGQGPARLLDMRPGRSSEVLRSWLQEREGKLREKVQVVAMGGFTGYATAVEQELPDAVRVMDPSHVVHLAAEKLTLCRQRLQRETTGRSGRKEDPLYKHRWFAPAPCVLLRVGRDRGIPVDGTDDIGLPTGKPGCCPTCRRRCSGGGVSILSARGRTHPGVNPSRGRPCGSGR